VAHRVLRILLWIAKASERIKVRQLGLKEVCAPGWGNIFLLNNLTANVAGSFRRARRDPIHCQRCPLFSGDNLTSSHENAIGKEPSYLLDACLFGTRYWSTSGWIAPVASSDRLIPYREYTLICSLYVDFAVFPLTNIWTDTAVSRFAETRTYVVQTTRLQFSAAFVMATDPGDLVLDPTAAPALLLMLPSSGDVVGQPSIRPAWP
jgi:hypothetical protein